MTRAQFSGMGASGAVVSTIPEQPRSVYRAYMFKFTSTATHTIGITAIGAEEYA